MPATDFGWSLNEKPPIFQVYGTKRKCSPVSPDNTDMVDTSPKRRCIATQDIDTVTMETQPVSIPDQYIHQRIPQQIPIAQSHQPMCSPAVDVMQSPDYPQLENNNNNNMPSLQPVFHTQSHYTQSHHMSHNTSQGSVVTGMTETGDHIVSRDHSLHDHVASQDHSLHDHVVSRDHSLHESVTNMEEDTPIGLQQHQQHGLSYCDNFCVGGDISPRSQRVRCYCIPSWEGLMDSRQYMSDIY